MTTAPYRNQHMVGVRSVFSLPASAPGHPRSVAVTALLNAVRAVAGVRHAELRTAAGGDRTLHLDLIDGADEAAVAWSVTRILDEEKVLASAFDGYREYRQRVAIEPGEQLVDLSHLPAHPGGLAVEQLRSALDLQIDVAEAPSTALRLSLQCPKGAVEFK